MAGRTAAPPIEAAGQGRAAAYPESAPALDQRDTLPPGGVFLDSVEVPLGGPVGVFPFSGAAVDADRDDVHDNCTHCTPNSPGPRADVLGFALATNVRPINPSCEALSRQALREQPVFSAAQGPRRWIGP